MRCKGCDYPLWDIAARACPECGLAFRPSDYEFAVNSVRFCCQHCGQAYYGTADRGHLSPSRFHCVSCARLIDMDEMLVLPRDGVPETISLPDRMPWLERHRIGFWRALMGTFVRAFGTPSRLADSIPMRAPDGSGGATILPALVYAMIFLIPYTELGASFMAIPAALGAVSGVGGSGAAAALSVAGSLLAVAISCIIFFVAWVLIAHVSLRVSGPTTGGLGGTFAALGYSAGVNFVSAIPCVGMFLAPVGLCWWAVVATMMAIRIHRVSAVRSALAFIVAPIAVAAILTGAVVLLGYAFTPSGRGAPLPPMAPIAPPPPVAPRTLSAVADRVAGASLAYFQREGAWPRTGLDLVRSNDIRATHLATMSDPASFAAGGMPLDQIELLLTDQLKRVADADANESTEPSGASRAGSVVFFTKGLTGTTDLTNVWIACVTPGGQGDQTTMFVVLADGSSVAGEMTQESVDAQNAIRRERGLPELPPLDKWPY